MTMVLLSANGKADFYSGCRGDANPPLGDGGLAINAALAGPLGITVDAGGNLYIADTSFYLIRKVSPAGIISTIAGRDYYLQNGPNDVGFPTAVNLDAAGNLLIATQGSIRKLSSNGDLSTIAGTTTQRTPHPSGDGGPATGATLQGPVGVASDAAGNLFVFGGELSGFFGIGGSVREVTGDGIINTIAGNGILGYSGDGGPAASASFSGAAAGIAVDAAGDTYVADVFNNVIRILRPAAK